MVKDILIDENKIQERVRELARELNKSFKDTDPVILGVLNGSFIFVADLVRYLDFPFELDFIRASSYGSGTESSGKVKISGLEIDIKGRNIILVDDILDTGLTLKTLVDKLYNLGAATITTVVIVNKPSRRTVGIDADYVGFEIPNKFIVGYGLDFNERFRNLPYIATIEE